MLSLSLSLSAVSSNNTCNICVVCSPHPPNVPLQMEQTLWSITTTIITTVIINKYNNNLSMILVCQHITNPNVCAASYLLLCDMLSLAVSSNITVELVCSLSHLLFVTVLFVIALVSYMVLCVVINIYILIYHYISKRLSLPQYHDKELAFGVANGVGWELKDITK